MDGEKCHDCGAEPGQKHSYGCDVERCPFCGGQLISCGCAYKELGAKYGWEYKPEILVPNGATAEIPEGYGMSYACPHVTVYSYPFNGLPEEVYEGGLTNEMEADWLAMLDEQGRLGWTGRWPGEEDCERLGFWCVAAPGRGWRSVSAGHPGARHDLNRLGVEAVWDRKKRMFVKREEACDA